MKKKVVKSTGSLVTKCVWYNLDDKKCRPNDFEIRYVCGCSDLSIITNIEIVQALQCKILCRYYYIFTERTREMNDII